MMMILLASRSIYYIVYRFINFDLNEETIDNDHLIFIYVEEIIFNLVVFYNLVGKELSYNHFEPHYHKVSMYHSREKSKERNLIQIDNSLVS